jgi:hypothetical protein
MLAVDKQLGPVPVRNEGAAVWQRHIDMECKPGKNPKAIKVDLEMSNRRRCKQF